MPLSGWRPLEVTMRIRILKSVTTVHGKFEPGDTPDIPDEMARDWCLAGIAMEDKSLDTPKDTKRRKA